MIRRARADRRLGCSQRTNMKVVRVTNAAPGGSSDGTAISHGRETIALAGEEAPVELIEHVMVVLVIDEARFSAEALEGTLTSVHRQTHGNWSLALVCDDLDEERIAQVGKIFSRPWYKRTLALRPSQVLAEARSRNADSVFVTRVGARLIDSTLERCVFLAGLREASLLALPIWRDWDIGHDLYFQSPTSEPLVSKSVSDDIDTAVTSAKYEMATYRRLSEAGPRTGMVVHDYLVEQIRRGSVWDPSDKKVGKQPKPQPDRDPLTPSGDIWLFAERKGTATADNAWAMFKWMCHNQPAIESYYVLNPDAPYTGPAEFADRIIRKGTLQWNSLVDRCKVALVNDSAGDLLLRLSHRQNYPQIHWVYLTHGALGVFPGVYQARHRYFDLICTESDHASDVASELWDFPRGNFAATGLTRWDYLQDTPQDGDLLFLPTWRKSLDDPAIDATASEFVQFTADFLGSERLNSLLERTDRKLRVGLHFRAQHLLEDIAAHAGDRIEIVDLSSPDTSVASELANCGAVISDYSSVSWDVLIQGKATFLCQFDKLDWCRERGMQQLLAPHTEALFEISYGVHELLDQLEARVLPTGIVPLELPDDIRERYIPRPGGSNCQAVFDEVIERFGPQSVPAQAAVRWTTEHYDLSPLGSGVDSSQTIFIGSNRLLLEMGPKALPKTMAQVDRLLDGGATEILFQPCLQGESSWADDLFSIEKTGELVQTLSAAAARSGAKLTVATMPDYPFRAELGARCSEDIVDLTLDEPSPFGPRSSIDVSVIVPCFNSEAGLERCIRSVMNQRFHGSVEVIVVDDGSTDGSSQIVHELQGEFDNLLYMGKPNGRQGSARNLGMLVCRGRTMTFLDSDDELSEDALSRLYVALEESDADISAGFHVSINERRTVYQLNQSHLHYLAAPRHISGEDWPGLHLDPSVVAKLYRTDFLLDNSLYFSYSYHEDELFRSLTELKGATYVNTREATYRYHGKSSVATGTTRFDAVKFSQVLRVGLLVSELFAGSASDDARRIKASHLLRRYVRFWQKCEGDPAALTPEVRALLKAFVGSVPEDWRWSVDGTIEMATELGFGFALPVVPVVDLAQDAGAELSEGAPPSGEDGEAEDRAPIRYVPSLDGSEVVVNELEPYDYFARRVLWRRGRGGSGRRNRSETDEVAESTSYKLGSMLVQALAHPGAHTAKLPFELSGLAYRALSRKARDRIASSSESDDGQGRLARRWASFRSSDVGDAPGGGQG